MKINSTKIIRLGHLEIHFFFFIKTSKIRSTIGFFNLSLCVLLDCAINSETGIVLRLIFNFYDFEPRWSYKTDIIKKKSQRIENRGQRRELSIIDHLWITKGCNLFLYQSHSLLCGVRLYAQYEIIICVAHTIGIRRDQFEESFNRPFFS